MQIDFDPEKNDKNIRNRGLPFEYVANLSWSSAIILEDARYDYNEKRFRVFALLGDRLHVAVITNRNDKIRVISFRKANKREINKYEKTTKESK